MHNPKNKNPTEENQVLKVLKVVNEQQKNSFKHAPAQENQL
jgi:nitrate/nitrite-specific signal transduction histidine kinase